MLFQEEVPQGIKFVRMNSIGIWHGCQSKPIPYASQTYIEGFERDINVNSYRPIHCIRIDVGDSYSPIDWLKVKHLPKRSEFPAGAISISTTPYVFDKRHKKRRQFVYRFSGSRKFYLSKQKTKMLIREYLPIESINTSLQLSGDSVSESGTGGLDVLLDIKSKYIRNFKVWGGRSLSMMLVDVLSDNYRFMTTEHLFK